MPYRPDRLPRLAIGAWLAFAAPSHAATLTFHEAIEQAATEAPAALAARQTGEAARQMARAARQLPDPTLSLGVESLPVTGSDAFRFNREMMTMKTIGLSQQWVRRSKREAASERFLREADVASAAERMAQLDARRQAAAAWLDLWFAQRERELIRAARDALELESRGVAAEVAAGQASAAGGVAVEAEKARLDNELAMLDGRTKGAAAALARWTQVPVTEIAGDPPAFEQLPPEADPSSHHWQQHLDVVAARLETRVAEAEVAEARAQARPDWMVDLMVGQRDMDQSEMVSLSVSIPLQFWKAERQNRTIAAASARQLAAEARAEEMVRAHRAEMEQLAARWRSRKQQLTRYDKTLLPLLKVRIDTLLAGLRAGQTGMDEVARARRELIETERARLETLRDMADAWVALAFLTDEHARGATAPTGAQPIAEEK